MSTKYPTIINGVDVYFCEYFNDKNKKCRTFRIHEGIKYTSYKCEDDKDCYYKQLKRTELAFENLKRRGTIPIVFIDKKLVDKYSDALKQIKRIAEGACDSSVCHYDCKQCSDGKIIDKISEVLNVEAN